MTSIDTGKHLGRLDALRSYVDARDAETASPGPGTTAAADAAYARYAALGDQHGPSTDGPCPELEKEAGG